MRADLRENGWWLIFEEGEEVGPFQRMEDAQAFLDLVDNIQQNRAKDARPPRPDDPAETS
jgi:hypothetical protein